MTTPPMARDLWDAADALRSRRPDLAVRLEAYARREARVSDSPKPLTRRQRELYDFLWGYAAANGYAPSFEEIGAHFGYRSLATVHEHMEALRFKGWVKRDFNLARATELLVDLSAQAVA